MMRRNRSFVFFSLVPNFDPELGPIAGPIAAAGIALTTAGQVAAIATQEPPSFLGGGSVEGYLSALGGARVEGPMSAAGGVPSLLHNQERVLTAQAPITDDEHAQLNRGERPGGLGGGGVTFQFRHLTRWIEIDRRDRVNSPGVLSDISQRARFGHDTARRGRHNGDL